MRKTGFFTRYSAKQARKEKSPKYEVRDEELRKLGPQAVKGMNPRARHPEMRPDGPEHPLVYVLTDAPGAKDDIQGQPLVGNAGQLLRHTIPHWALRETTFDHVVRTRTPDGRVPWRSEIECFRTTVEASIEKAKPRVILGVGALPLRWMLGLKEIKGVRGKKYPVRVGKHVCWFVPTVHPAFILRIQDEREDKVPGKEWLKFWKQDINNAYDLAEDNKRPTLADPEEAKAGTKHCLTLEAIREAIQHLLTCKAVGFDTESHNFRPYNEDSKLLTIAFSDGDVSFAIPIDHSGHNWGVQRKTVISLIRELFEAKSVVKVAHHIPHDLEWILYHFGSTVLEGNYGCSLQAAFVLDPGPPGRGSAGHGLDDLCLEYFGLPLKQLTAGAKWVKRLQEKPVADVLDYNALDAKWCLRLWKVLMVRIHEEKLLESYKRQMDRVPAVINAQFVGVSVDQAVRQKFDEEMTAQIAETLRAIHAEPEIQKYAKKNPSFSINSPKELGLYLGDYLGVEAIRDAGYSTKASLLEVLRDEHPLIDNVLKMRGLEKLLGTYVKRFDPRHPESYIYPDGRIHSKFMIAGTRTARLSSGEPNCFPGDVEVLTMRGWVRWDATIPEDKLAQYDLDSGMIDFVAPLQWICESNPSGEIVRIITKKHVSIRCTANHGFWLKSRRGKWWHKEATDYPEDYHQINAGDYVGGYWNVPEHRLILMAAFHSGGHIVKRNDNVEWNLLKKRKIDRLRGALDTEGIVYRCDDDRKDGKTRFIIVSGNFPEWLKPWKILDERLLLLAKPSFDFMAEEIWFWGGYQVRRSTYRSNEKSNADWVQILTSLTRRRSKLFLGGLQSNKWQVDTANTDTSLTKNRKIETLPHKGKVYCAEMPKGTLVVRDDNRVCITGNSQNWPARKNNEVRKQLTIPPGHVWVAVDQGQIEARVLAMESQDDVWIKMIKEKYDVHQEWAEKLAEIDTGFARILKEQPKVARHMSKNGWVFPAFYGSSLFSILRNVGLTNVEAAEELFRQFWETFGGVKEWQRRQKNKYDRNGYVKSLTGRRRWGPLSWNQIINSPVQATASDICVDAMVRLWKRSVREKLPWMAAVLQIHDDLTFVIPEDCLSYGVEAVVEEQLRFDADWVNVPLSVEVKVGPDLTQMKVLGEWTTDDLGED